MSSLPIRKTNELEPHPVRLLLKDPFIAHFTPGHRSEMDGLGLMYYGAHWYDPYITQFSQPDTIIPDPYNSQDWNRYSYVRNNPLNYVDPSGHVIKPPCPSGCLIWDYSNVGGQGFKGRVVRALISTSTELVDFFVTQGFTQTDPAKCTWSVTEADDRTTVGLVPPVLLGVNFGGQLPLPGFAKYLEETTTYEVHHLVTNKGDYWPGVMRTIIDKYKLDLDGSWNKVPLPGHRGSHTNQ